MTTIKPVTIHKLPDEMLIEIFSYMTVEEIVRFIKLVCIRWYKVTEDVRLWTQLVYKPTRHTHLCNIICVLKNSPHLRNFAPEVCVDRNVIPALMTYCKNLRRLEFTGDQCFESDVLKQLVFHFPHVESFSGQICTRGCNLLWLSQWTNLKRIGLIGSKNNLNSACVGLCECKRLEKINLGMLREEYNVSNESIQEIITRKIDKLKSLTFTTYFLEFSTIKLLADCSKIEELRIHNSSNAAGIDFSPLKTLKLKSLALVRFNESPAFLKETVENSSWSDLKKLDLTFYKLCNDEAVCAVVEKCPVLEKLTLEGCYDITDKAFEDFHKLKKLDYLNISKCPLLTDDAIKHIGKCENLKTFLIKENDNITDNIFYDLVKCKKIESIYIDGCSEVTGRFCRMLKKFKHLQTVSISDCDNIDTTLLKIHAWEINENKIILSRLLAPLASARRSCCCR